VDAEPLGLLPGLSQHQSPVKMGWFGAYSRSIQKRHRRNPRYAPTRAATASAATSAKMLGPRSLLVIGFSRKASLRRRFIEINVAAAVCLCLTGRISADGPSVTGVVGGLIIMNLVAWISSRHFKEWK